MSVEYWLRCWSRALIENINRHSTTDAFSTHDPNILWVQYLYNTYSHHHHSITLTNIFHVTVCLVSNTYVHVHHRWCWNIVGRKTVAHEVIAMWVTVLLLPHFDIVIFFFNRCTVWQHGIYLFCIIIRNNESSRHVLDIWGLVHVQLFIFRELPTQTIPFFPWANQNCQDVWTIYDPRVGYFEGKM